MARYILILIIICNSHFLFGQTGTVDSLAKVIASYKQDDVTKLQLLNEAAYACHTANARQGLQYGNSAILLGEKLGRTRELAEAYSYTALNLDVMGNDSEALHLYDKAIAIYEHTRNENGKAQVLHNIGLLYSGRSEYYKALEFQKRSLDIFQKSGMKDGIAKAKLSIGVNHLFLGEHNQAARNFMEVLRLTEQTGDKRTEGDAYENLGILHKNMLDVDLALQNIKKAIDLFKETDDKTSLARGYENLGNLYDDMDSSALAMAMYRKALALNIEIGNYLSLASNYTNMGIVAMEVNDYSTAFEYLEKGRVLYGRLRNAHGGSVVMNQLGNLLVAVPETALKIFGLSKRERFNRAIKYYKHGLMLAEKAHMPEKQRDSWENLAAAYEMKGDIPQAYAAYKNFIKLQDSITNTAKRRELLRKEAAFEYEKKETLLKAENAFREARAQLQIRQQRQQRNMVAIGGGGLLAFLVLLLMVYKKRRDAEGRLKEARYKTEVAETEMKALRAQMNPHFIFNSLSSINDYILRSDMGTASLYVTKFAKLMRIVLENSEHKEISLQEELDALALYMQLESMRIGKKMHYEILSQEHMNMDEIAVPPLLLQPFVENAIWHGIAPRQEGGQIRIEVAIEGNLLKCVIADNGVGRTFLREANNIENGNKESMGIKITSERLRMAGINKKSTGTIKIEDTRPGVRVTIFVPIA